MYYIGIDIGGMTIKGGLVDDNGDIVVKEVIPTQPEREHGEIVKDLALLCQTLMEKGKIDKSAVKGVGLGIPGTINSQDGIITYANNINFENVPIIKEFNELLDIPVRIGNDANCAALGERVYGAGKNRDNIVMITLGTGVGSGIIIDGELFEGKKGAGAEAGHMCIRVGGEECTCGRLGCWEAYASATALVRQTTKGIKKYPTSLMAKIAEEEGKVSGRTAFRAARENDDGGKKVVHRYLRYLAEGLVNLVNIFRPDIVIIGGGVSNEGEYLIKRLQRLVNRYSFGSKRNPLPKIVEATLKNDAGILGAAALWH